MLCQNGKHWPIGIHCKHGIDITFDLTLHTILSRAQQNSCVITKIVPYDVPLSHQACYRSNVISKCNSTGLWMESEREEGIRWACENVSLPMPEIGLVKKQAFKNIFCYICNTNDSTLSTIASCNAT